MNDNACRPNLLHGGQDQKIVAELGRPVFDADLGHRIETPVPSSLAARWSMPAARSVSGALAP